MTCIIEKCTDKAFDEDVDECDLRHIAWVSPDWYEESKRAAVRIAEKATKHLKKIDIPVFMSIDFAYAEMPQLIEMQSFPSLMARSLEFEQFVAKKKSLIHSDVNIRVTSFRKILSSESGKKVALLEWKPHLQRTKFDFDSTVRMCPDVIVLDFSKITIDKKNGQFYFVEDGKGVYQIDSIYNRIVIDDVPEECLTKLDYYGSIVDKLWINSPKQLHVIDKSIMCSLCDESVPYTKFVCKSSDIETKRGVLKPLHGHSGQGVYINPTIEEWNNIKTLEDNTYIWQSLINFKPVQYGENLYEMEIRWMLVFSDNQWVPLSNMFRASKDGVIGDMRFQNDALLVGVALPWDGDFC